MPLALLQLFFVFFERMATAAQQGHVPVKFVLAREEIAANDAPPPCYVLAPRNAYLPIVADPVRAQFAPYAPPSMSAASPTIDGERYELWFEFNGAPVRWHVAIGVLHDIYTASCSAASCNNHSVQGTALLPLCLTVHFLPCPHPGVVLRCPSETTVRDYFMNTVKEAVYLMYGSVKTVMSLSKVDQDELWNSFKANRFEDYTAVNAKLHSASASVIQKRKNLAIRFYVVPQTSHVLGVQDGGAAATSPAGHAQAVLIQQPFPAPDDDELKVYTLEQVLCAILPNVVACFNPPVIADNVSVRDLDVLVQGLTPPLNTPIVWLVDHCSNADGFLHITLAGP